MNLLQCLSIEFILLFKAVILILFLSWLIIVVYYYFSNMSIFINANETYINNNIKSFFYLFVYSLSAIFVIFIVFLDMNLYNGYKIGLNNGTVIPTIYFIKISFFSKFFANIFSFSLTKFNLAFFLLFSVLYPIIFAVMSFDNNNLNSKLYIYVYTIFIISYLLLFVENIIIFYFLYEVLLILVFFVMYLTANSRGGIEAAIYFATWAILGSILVGLGILMLLNLTKIFTFDLLKYNRLTYNEVYYIYLLFFFGFGVKLSVWPFWYWLPKAHVEVSTGMSIFLSCILIKLSFFSLLRFQQILLTEISYTLCIIVASLTCIDIVYRFINLRDLKAIIAYGSVLHTNLLLILIHLDSFKNLKTSIYYIWGHSLATATMFLVVNALEIRYSSRNILYISGVWYTSPSFGYLMFFSLISFLDIPLSVFFWGELWLWVLALNKIFLLAIQILFAVNVIFICIFFKIWWSLLFGTPDVSTKKINSNEVNFENNSLIIWLVFIQILIGVQPAILSFLCGLYI